MELSVYFDFEVTGVGYRNEGGLCFVGGEAVFGFSHPAISRVVEVRLVHWERGFFQTSKRSAGFGSPLQIGQVCNNAEVIDGDLRGQPTEGALVVLALKVRMTDVRQEYVRLSEIPFSSETKWMAVRVRKVKSGVRGSCSSVLKDLMKTSDCSLLGRK